jgi:hypothetical protein
MAQGAFFVMQIRIRLVPVVGAMMVVFLGAGTLIGYRAGLSQPKAKTESQLRCDKAVTISRKIDRANLANLLFVAAEAAHEQIISQSEFLAVKRRLETPGEDLGKLANDVQSRLIECVPVAQPYKPIE